MEAACEVIIPGSHLINCMWHLDENRRKCLKKGLDARWGDFETRFKEVRSSITPSEFEAGWQDLVQDFGSQNVRNSEKRKAETRAPVMESATQEEYCPAQESQSADQSLQRF